jgi:hypothetical protein
MNIDTPSASPLRPMSEVVNTMIDERNLKLHGEEVDKYNSIKDRGVTLSRIIDPALLRRTGMDIKLNHISVK